MASELADSVSDAGGENDVLPPSSISSISNDQSSEPHIIMSETDDSNSYSIEPSSSETESYMGTASRGSSEAALAGSASKEPAGDGAYSKFPVRPGITWRRGERLEAMDYLQKWYPAKIMDIDEEERCVLIHFEGWNQRYDEWVEMDSDNLRPLTRHSERRDKRRKEKTVYKAGDQVLAKWTDCKMYLAKIDEVLSDGSYVVLFYDGFKKTIQPINLRPVPSDLKQQKFQIKPPVLSPKDLKKLKHKPVDYKDKASTSDAPSTSATATTSTATTPPKAHPHPNPVGHKKKKLIISGSLFAKKDKLAKTEKEGEKARVEKGEASETETQTKPQKKSKEGGKVQVREEPTGEAVPELEEKTAGTEASCQTDVATSAEPPAKKKKRAGSFPPTIGRGKKVGGAGRTPKAGKGTVGAATVKKAKSTDEGKAVETQVPVSTVPVLPAAPGIPPKAFIVEEDHNPYKCTVPGCGKGFRKAGLLASHVKYYHCENDGPPSTPHVPRKRKKTLSTCSTDSDISVSSRSTSSRRRRHISELSAGTDLAVRMSFEDDFPNNTGRLSDLPPVDETAGAETEEESSEEVVNCICGFREENGLMIQCDACLCWQHTMCFNITEQDLSNNSTYICFVCKRPPGVRESCRYLYDLDWFRKGRLPTFSFLNLIPSERRQRELLASHDLVAEMLKVQSVLHGLREEIAVTGDREHPELNLWHPKTKAETRSVSVSTSEKDAVPSSSSTPGEGGEHTPAIGSTNSSTVSQPEDKTVGPVLQVDPSDPILPSCHSSGGEHGAERMKGQEDSAEKSTAPSVQQQLQQPEVPSKTTDVQIVSAAPSQGKTSTAEVSAGSVEVPGNSADATETSASTVRPSLDSGPTSAGIAGASSGTEQTSADSSTAHSDTEFNPLVLTPPSAQLRGGQCDHKRVKPVPESTGASQRDSSDGASVSGPSTSEAVVNGKIKLEGEERRESGTDLTNGPEQRRGEKDGGESSCSLTEREGKTKTQDQEIKEEIKTEPIEAAEEEQSDDKGGVETVQKDPFSDCKVSVLKYVHQVQGELALALDALELQISDLERQEFGDESSGSFSSVPSLKQSLYRIARDLNKVKGIASYR